MKKLSILLSLALVAMLSTGVLAAQDIDLKLNGKVSADLRYGKPDGDKDTEYALTAYGYSLVELKTSVSTGNLKMSLGTMAKIEKKDAAGNWAEDPYNNSTEVELKLDSARFELKGAYWKDGPEVTTTLGRHSVNWSDWVFSNRFARPTAPREHWDNATRNAIQISGLELDPVTISVIHGWDEPRSQGGNDYGQDRPTAIKVDGEIDVLSFGLVAVNHEPVAAGASAADRYENRAWDMALNAAVTPADGIEIDATYAIDGQGDGNEAASAYNVVATLDTIPDVTLTGTVYQAGQYFAPRYARYDRGVYRGYDDDDYLKADGGPVDPEHAIEESYVAFAQNRRGFEIAAETKQGDVTLNGSYGSQETVGGRDYSMTETSVGASTNIQDFEISASYTTKTEDPYGKSNETKASVGTEVAGVNVKYTATLETKYDDEKPLKNEIEASTTVDTPFADDVKLAAKVTVQDGTDTAFYADATWTAPNGLRLGLHYANYDRKAKFGEYETTSNGFYATAGYTLSF